MPTDPCLCVCPSPSWAVLGVALLGAAVLASYLRTRTRRALLALLVTRTTRLARAGVAILDVCVTLSVGAAVGLAVQTAAGADSLLCILIGTAGAALVWLPALVRSRAPAIVDRIAGEAARRP